MALFGNFIGNALGMQSAEEYTQSVEAASRLRDLQNRNQSLKDEANVPITNEATGQVGGLRVPDAFSFDNLTQPPLTEVPPEPVEPVAPPVTQTPETQLVPRTDGEGNIIVETEDGSLPEAPATTLTDPFTQEGNTLLPPAGDELPPVPPYRRNGDNTARNQEIARRTSLENTMREIYSAAGIRRRGGQGTQNVTAEQGRAYTWWTSDEAFRLFYNNPQELERARQDPINYALDYMGQADQRTTSTVVPESTERTERLITGRIDGLRTQIGSNRVQQVYRLANEIGIDPFAAIAIFGIESDFGRARGDSARGARGGMQVMPAQFERLKRWFADPANRTQIESAFTLPDGTVNQARVDYAIEQFSNMRMPNARGQGGSANPEIISGLAQLVYNKAIGLPKNLWGAGYQGNANTVLELGRPLNADDGNISNSDYNRAYVTLYNHIYQTYGAQLSEVQTPYGIDLNTIQGSGVGRPQMVQAPPVPPTTQPTTQPEVSTEPPARTEVTPPVTETTPPTTPPTTETAPPPPESAANLENEVDIEVFVTNPSGIPIETQRVLDARRMMTDSLNRNLNEINRAIATQNRRADEFSRLAQIARRNRQRDVANSYLAQADTARQNAEQLRESGLALSDQARQNIFEYDNRLLLMQGAQALSDLSFGSTARAGAVLSAYSGYEIQINPRSDGRFDMVVNGTVQQTYTYAELSQRLQLAYDQSYREASQERAASRADAIFESDLDTAAEIRKIQAQMIANNAEAAVKAAYDQELERIKNSNGQVFSLGDGKAIIRQGNGNYILIDPNGQIPDVNNPGEMTRGLQRIPLTNDQASGLMAGSSGDPYATN